MKYLFPFFLFFPLAGFPVAATLEIRPFSPEPVYQGVPFEGLLKIDPWEKDPGAILQRLKDFSSKNFLYIVRLSELKKVQDEKALEITGTLSLTGIPPSVAIDETVYRVGFDHEFIKGREPIALFLFSHGTIMSPRMKLFLLLLAVAVLSLGLFATRKILFRLNRKRYQKQQRIKAKEWLDKAEVRRDFEELYVKREVFYDVLDSLPPGNTPFQGRRKFHDFFQKIEYALYIPKWDQSFLDELQSVKQDIKVAF